jgi:hypothetical protein
VLCRSNVIGLVAVAVALVIVVPVVILHAVGV